MLCCIVVSSTLKIIDFSRNLSFFEFVGIDHKKMFHEHKNHEIGLGIQLYINEMHMKYHLYLETMFTCKVVKPKPCGML